MARERKMIAPRLHLERVMLFAGVLTISLVLMMYIVVRALKLLH
jgi:hypothetical protein